MDATVVLTVGTDCNIGKMTTQLQLLGALRDKGIRTSFAATGQTGILIEGRGISVDAVVADFIAGAAEKLVLDCARRVGPRARGRAGLDHPSELLRRDVRPDPRLAPARAGHVRAADRARPSTAASG